MKMNLKRKFTVPQNGTVGLPRREFLSKMLALGACAAGALFAAHTASAQQVGQVGDVFVIAMENHNFTQPNPGSSPQQILNNVAAPYINSLITPGNANAAQVSYETQYYNSGNTVHPSEPNYVWAEAGSNLGTTSDSDPSTANHNLFTGVPTLTSQMDAAGISWKNYQEDLQYTTAPGVSKSGTQSVLNPYYGTGQYNYAAKHNPMAFFTDSANKNVFQLSQLTADLNNNTVGRYNWITPNQFNDAHSALTGGFTYKGTHYTGDQAAVAQGDNFLSQIIPQIMASQAYQNNGEIVIWWDESEGGDSTSFTIPEIVISPLAKGNGYASSVVTSHSSDIKTMEELLGLGTLNNAIPTGDTAATGGYNTVAGANDLSDLFVSGAIVPVPEIPAGGVVAGLSLVGLLGLRRRAQKRAPQA